MKKPLSKALVAVALVLALNACTAKHVKQGVGVTIGNAAGTKVGYTGYECEKIKQACPVFEYQEWLTSENKTGCSCKKQH